MRSIILALLEETGHLLVWMIIYRGKCKRRMISFYFSESLYKLMDKELSLEKIKFDSGSFCDGWSLQMICGFQQKDSLVKILPSVF